MAITKKVNPHFIQTETSIDTVVDELVKIAQSRLDVSWNDISEETLSKIHAEIMAELFMKFGRRIIEL